LIRGVAPQMRDRAAYLTLGGGAGGRSLGSIFCITRIAALYLLLLCRCASVPRAGNSRALSAFDALFNRCDYAGAERYWSDRYIQHSAHIGPGRQGWSSSSAHCPIILAEGDYVIAHGRFSGIGRPAAWIAADVVRFEDGKLANVGPNEQGFVDAFNAQMLSLSRSG
jgi:predicted SnoaL-like aldol condensation-catalyzing enzyme